MRALFYLLYHLFAKHLPVSHRSYALGARQVRYWAWRLARCGKNVSVKHGADIGTGRHIEVGDNPGIGVNCVVKRAIIGRNVMMGPDVVFVPQNHEFSDAGKLLQEQGHRECDPIVIGDNTWIGTRAIIPPPRNMGKGAIVGANSVVAKDVPDYATVAGNPP